MSNDEDWRTVGEVAAMLGLTVRTLHYWEERGLIGPSERTWSEYRLYSDEDIARIQQIMVYKATGMPLKQIAQLLDESSDAVTHLRRQRTLLMQQRRKLGQMVRAIDRLLEDAMGQPKLSVEEVAEILGDAAFPTYQGEAQQRWGETDDWTQSQRTASSMSRGQWQEVKAETDALEERLADAMREGLAPQSEQAQALAEEHRAQLARFFPVSHAKHVLIASGYVADPRFQQHYDQRAQGLAAWLKEAIDANAEAHGVNPAEATWE